MFNKIALYNYNSSLFINILFLLIRTSVKINKTNFHEKYYDDDPDNLDNDIFILVFFVIDTRLDYC